MSTPPDRMNTTSIINLVHFYQWRCLNTSLTIFGSTGLARDLVESLLAVSDYQAVSDYHDHPRPVFPARPQSRAPGPSVPCRTSTARKRQKECQTECREICKECRAQCQKIWKGSIGEIFSAICKRCVCRGNTNAFLQDCRLHSVTAGGNSNSGSQFS